MVKGLLKGKYEIVLPFKMMLLMKTLRLLPNALFFRLVNIALTAVAPARTARSAPLRAHLTSACLEKIFTSQ